MWYCLEKDILGDTRTAKINNGIQIKTVILQVLFVNIQDSCRLKAAELTLLSATVGPWEASSLHEADLMNGVGLFSSLSKIALLRKSDSESHSNMTSMCKIARTFFLEMSAGLQSGLWQSTICACAN